MSSPFGKGKETNEQCAGDISRSSNRRHWFKPVLMAVTALIVLHLFTLVILLSVIDLSGLTAPHSRLSKGPNLNHAPGVGFDLTASYGTAVVRHHNGSVSTIGPIAAGADYEEMMNRFSIGGRYFDPYASYCTPGGFLDSYTWPSLKRLVRRSFGLPSTVDVGRLVKVLRSLREATEDHLGHSLTGVVVTSPNFPWLCNRDVEEAIRHVGLDPLSPHGHAYQPHEIATAYARHGFGLCKNNTSFGACSAEENQLPSHHVLAVSHTDTAFLATLDTMKSAFASRQGLEDLYVADFELGLDSLLKHDWNTYWDRIELHIQELILRNPNQNPIDKVLLLGEGGVDRNLMKVLEYAISQHQDNMPEIYRENPLFDAAQGAAEVAKRAQEYRALSTSEALSFTQGMEL